MILRCPQVNRSGIFLFLLIAISVGCRSIKAAESGTKVTVATTQEIEFPAILKSPTLPFLSHTGPKPFDNALAMNVTFAPIQSLRLDIEKITRKTLKNFQGWNSAGEAHITVVTPPEFTNVLSKFLTMKEIEQIALAQDIQNANVFVYGVGSGRKQIAGIEEETFFVLVDSSKLREIRSKIWQAYIQKGGAPNDWDPSWFFPHITVGFTKQDIHEPDVIKSIRGSFDTRIRLKLQ